MEVVNFYKIGLIIPDDGEYIGREYRKFGYLIALKDKILVCFCKPAACHGDILKAFVLYAVNKGDELDFKIAAYKRYKAGKA